MDDGSKVVENDQKWKVIRTGTAAMSSMKRQKQQRRCLRQAQQAKANRNGTKTTATTTTTNERDEQECRGRTQTTTTTTTTTSSSSSKTAEATANAVGTCIGTEDSTSGITYPHDYDVLSGRGNLNHHPGNEYVSSN